jgi:SAM-dependent methyltransferase
LHPSSASTSAEPTSACTACGSARLRAFYRLAGIPVHSCLLVPSREAALAFPTGDLELVFCEACGFIFNRLFDEGLHDYSPDYEETQGFSPRFRRFMEELWTDQTERHGLGPHSTVLEIGCGKGEFLLGLCERAGCRGIGIDPAYRPDRTGDAAVARVSFIQEFYGERHLALEADHVVCRHTLEHIGPVLDFLRLVRRGRGRSLFFELPDMERILVERAFWDIYYEHAAYFTRGSLARLFRRADFAVTRLAKLYDGQYLLLEAVPEGSAAAASLPGEDDRERTAMQVEAFALGVREQLGRLGEAAADWHRQGRRAVVWGSGSKATGYLTTLGLRDEVAAVVDINPFKRGRFVAGTGHEILAPQDLEALRPDIVVVMNAVYGEEIAADLRGRGRSPEITALT